MSYAGLGRLVAVVGPSGTGKDSLISAARVRLADDPRFCFPRRVVTRSMHDASEDHDSLSEAEFAQAARGGQFALAWQAHGYHYGIPVRVLDEVAAGRIVTVNVSRTMIPQIEDLFARVLVVHVSCDPDILARRIAARGREDAAEIKRRLAREAPLSVTNATLVPLTNNGTLEEAAARFTAILSSA
ncbi:phosphonate metabolism protein/1,5-bisphosphokinase (PRPP-forming) PhnN [Methylovirgula sp. 4M-Z18]|uniref:phosphonate metabolism protein/1,5-bisphosphokinase (PRPP-forming) PhnN n=1 Tax=Methylovirgula sp. 4M-Z18 TaxID=2293567 RepID=UPI001313F122|nr:phosphonate metabolism protein/1,5-bisphosphokinase (PRPP-forming) PhnN [Methylovirgula sp. 4M-Z18]